MVGCKQISPHIHVELLLVIILGKPTAISRLTVKTNQFSRLKYNVLLSLAYYYTLECRLIAHWSQRRHKDSFTYVDITSNLTDTVLRCRAACTVRILPQKFIAYPDTIHIYISIAIVLETLKSDQRTRYSICKAITHLESGLQIPPRCFYCIYDVCTFSWPAE